MTDMENLDTGTEEQKKNHWAAMREKYDGKISELQAKLDAEIAGRAADKKLYFGNTMKSRGYDGDFNEFADKYSTLSIEDMVSLYEGQHGTPTVIQKTVEQPSNTESTGAKSVIEGANPTTEVGGKKMSEMNTEELLQFAKTQSWYKG